MNIDQITALIATGESETLEFKTTTGTRREAAMTVCAFLNQRGGQALFRVPQTAKRRFNSDCQVGKEKGI